MKKNRLKEIRESKCISQSELSRRTTISQQQISNYEKNSNMREDDIREICKALGVSADYLLGLIDDDNDTKKD